MESSLKYPTSITTISEEPYENNDWSDEENVGADDGSNASIISPTFDTNDYSYILAVTGFGFEIPEGHIIDGILIEVEGYNDAGETVK